MRAPTAGTMVTPSVRLIELLAEGGMGSVWLADHLSLQTRVAVKLIAPAIAGSDPSLRERFKREAAICAQLRSIHVVQVFDHGVMENGWPYIVMELLEGTPLTDRIESKGPMSPRQVGMVVAQVAKVLHRAHVLGIVHRDIKPDNIFLVESDYDLLVKVLDFGIAKQTRATSKGDEMTKTGAVVGTPDFMSPEQAVSSKHIDFKSDLWSLGVVAYYALTGELPFDEDAPEPIWLQMTHGSLLPASARRPDLPAAIDGWFAHALRPNPDDRFASAREMADALAQVLEPGREPSEDDLNTSLSDDQHLTERIDRLVGGSNRGGAAQQEGTDSEKWGGRTVLMNDEDHRDAEGAAALASFASIPGQPFAPVPAGSGAGLRPPAARAAGDDLAHGGAKAAPSGAAAASTAAPPGAAAGAAAGGSREQRRQGLRRKTLGSRHLSLIVVVALGALFLLAVLAVVLVLR